MNRYEGMFLFDNAAAQDWPAITQEVDRLLDRIGAQLQVCLKFDERRLAYEIKRRKRGTYALAYFDAPADKITDLERDARLSELVLRTLVLRADAVDEQKIAELKARPADVPLLPAATDGRRGDGDYRGRRGRPGSGPPRDTAPAQKKDEPAAADKAVTTSEAADAPTDVSPEAVTAAPTTATEVPATPADSGPSPASLSSAIVPEKPDPEPGPDQAHPETAE